MSLAPIVQALGGDLYDSGHRASIPAPGHSRADRSVSLRLVEGRVLVHSFGAADWREVLADLRARGLVDAAGRSQGGAGEADPAMTPTRLDRLAAAQHLWAGARPVAGTLSARHLRLRRVGRDPGLALGHHAAVPLAVYRGGAATRPALLAAISGPDGALVGVEATYLAADGQRHGRLRISRKIIGHAPRGCAVRLDPASGRLLVGEGVFTSLSAAERFGWPAWALLSAGNLAAWSPPPGVAEVLVAADRDPTGMAAARTLARRLAGAAISIRIVVPPAGFGDWNDVATGTGRGGLGEAG